MIKKLILAISLLSFNASAVDVVLGITSRLAWQGSGTNRYAVYLSPLKAVAWYKMDDNAASTTVIDSSENGNDGDATANTITLAGSGKIGGSMDFSNEAYVTVPHISALNMQELSICVWVKCQTPGGTIVSKQVAGWSGDYSKYNLRVDASKVQFWTDSYFARQIMSTDVLNYDVWNHVVATYDGDKQRIYVNGALTLESPSVGSGIGESSYDLAIGSHGTGANSGEGFLSGRLDDVRIYDKALNQAEIAELYNNGNGLATELTVVRPLVEPEMAPSTVTITFDVQFVPGSSADFYENEYTIDQYFSDSPYLPTWYPPAGYLWDGYWYENSNYYYSGSVVPSTSVTLYPSYIALNTLTFDYQGGTDNSGVPSAYFTYGYQYSYWNWPWTDPTRAGYIFLGWNTSSDGNGSWVASSDYYYDYVDVTLYAIWQAE